MSKDKNATARQRHRKIAVVVPTSNRAQVTPDEEISLRHLRHYLYRYEKYLVAPKSLVINWPDFGLKRFDDRFFGSAAAYARLMLSRSFYETFQDYEYILIYHLDALVFSDQLEQWCDTGLDYVASPWLESNKAHWIDEPQIGNGGFSLRKVCSFLKVLNSSRYSYHPETYWERHKAKEKGFYWLSLPRKYIKYVKAFNNVRWETSRFIRNEDIFWSIRAKNYYPEFKLASVEQGLRFAFEENPRLCFKKNNYELPFGCHAWPRYDRSFWEPYLLK